MSPLQPQGFAWPLSPPCQAMLLPLSVRHRTTSNTHMAGLSAHAMKTACQWRGSVSLLSVDTAGGHTTFTGWEGTADELPPSQLAWAGSASPTPAYAYQASPSRGGSSALRLGGYMAVGFGGANLEKEGTC